VEVILTDENFEAEILKAELPCLVDFWAPWCGPCRMVSPVVEEIAKEYEGKLKVGKLNVDKGPQTASQYGIMSIPTISIFKGGKRVDTVVGAVPKEEIVSVIIPHF